MGKKYDFFYITEKQVEVLRKLCPLNTFNTIAPSDLIQLKILPESLLEKTTSILIVASGSSDCEAYYMLNLNRADPKDNAIDQMPFGFICSGSTPLTRGYLTQHGDWTGRTHEPKEEFWNCASGSNINSFFPLAEMPQEKSGNIENLEIVSQNEAFSDLVSNLRKKLKNEK